MSAALIHCVEWAAFGLALFAAWVVLGLVGVVLVISARRYCLWLAVRRDRRAWARFWRETTYYTSDWEKADR